jgi:hypothetical protein
MEQGTLIGIKVRCGAGVMIVRSDRDRPPSGDEVRANPQSGSAAPTTLGIVWGAKAEPPVYLFPGGFAVNAQ